MAAVPQKTLNWLWGVLQQEYRDTQRTYSDLAQTLALYPGFSPRTQVYTYENGTAALLLRLSGTIPVNFRGSQYRFPVVIWVPHAYPREAPLLYVDPSHDMIIRPGQYVSPSDGQIYHPYLARWREAWERSTISDFLKLLGDVFAREPPVMSRQQTQAQEAPHLQQSLPRPPPLIDQRSSSARPPPNASGAPLPPPKPTDQLSGSRSSYNEQQRPGRYDAPPALPGQALSPRPLPIASPQPQSHQQQHQYKPQSQGGPVQSYLPQQPPPHGLQQSQRHSVVGPPPPTHYHQPLSPNTPAPRPQSVYNYQPGQSQQQIQQPFLTQQPQSQLVQQPQTPYQPHLQPPKPKQQEPNIMDDSPFDVTLSTSRATNLPTPIIPPNPEKQHVLQTLQSSLLSTLQTSITQSSSALGPLQAQYAALQSAQATLQQELSQLQTLQSQLQQNITSLNNTIASADRTISNARNESLPNKIPSIDDIIIPPTVVARQLYDNVTEQRGYEAAIYALTEGFVRGRIGGELWARKTRECAREEFRRKWLVRRVGRGMGLDLSQAEA